LRTSERDGPVPTRVVVVVRITRRLRTRRRLAPCLLRAKVILAWWPAAIVRVARPTVIPFPCAAVRAARLVAGARPTTFTEHSGPPAAQLACTSVSTMTRPRRIVTVGRRPITRLTRAATGAERDGAPDGAWSCGTGGAGGAGPATTCWVNEDWLSTKSGIAAVSSW
jgi:hypothetical protein